MDAKQLRDGDFFEVTGSIFKNIKESWEAVKLNLVTLLLLYLIPTVLLILATPLLILPAITGTDAGTATAVILMIVGLMAVFVLWLFILPAIVLAQLASVQGKKVEFQDALKQGQKYVLRYIGLGVLSWIAIVAGLIVFIIPGLLIAFFLSAAPYLLVDKNLGVIESMKASYELTKEYWKPVVGVLLVFFVINLPSYVPLIGNIITLALSIAYLCLPAYIYSVVTGKKVAKVS